MGNKTTNKQNNNSHRLVPHVHLGGIQKRVHEAKTSRVGRKARDIVKKNWTFFSKGMNPLIKYNTNGHLALSPFPHLSSLSNKLPSNDEEDAPFHQAVYEALSQEYALHASPSSQNIASVTDDTLFPPVDALPRNWKESLKPDQLNLDQLSPKEIKYQELIYEIILTEQSYVDDLILVHKIFIKETLAWDGLPSAVKKLFEHLAGITKLHMQFLQELRSRQVVQHPKVSTITDICRSFIPRLDIYASYFSCFEKANNIINDSIKNGDELGSFITRRSKWAECRNLPLSAYLLTPIQRVMKYPLFFKSLAECLGPTDIFLHDINLFLEEMEVTLRYFEEQKKESEDYLKLEDLACRIKGLEGSTIRIAEPGRRLIYEGYLNIVPTDSSFTSSRLDESTHSFSSVLHTPTLTRRNSTFSLSAKKSQRTYVFLFNDMIVCTRERYKKKSSPTESGSMGPPARKGSFYGPSADTLFKITHTPGKITLVDRAVTREVIVNNNEKHRRGSALFQSLRRYGSRLNGENNDNNIPPSPSSEFSQVSYFNSQSCSEMYGNNHSSVIIERHPLQFICSIATRNLINIRFETETPEEKDLWCHHLESVLEEHVQRNRAHHKRASLSPTQSTFSIDSVSSAESTPYVAAWSGYCDVETMDVDDLDQEFSIGAPPTDEEGKNLIKSEDLLQTIIGEFGDSIWQTSAPAGLSPLQLRRSFLNLGKSIE